jgi:hypothetical protein
MKNIYFLIVLLVTFSQFSNAQWIINDKVSDSITVKGVNYIYNLEFESAEKEFNELIKREPGEPAGYFFYAMVDWWRMMLDYDNESYDAAFKSKLQKVIDVCDARLEKDEFDIVALFFKCGSIGFRGRLFSHRDSWLKAADDGRLAYPILMKAYKLAPNNYDILLGIGIYDYFADVIPDQYPILKPIMLFFPKGNKLRGIDELKVASEKAHYANTEASYFLLQVYLNYENNPYPALDVALKLYNKYPDNSVFHRYLGRTYVKLGKWVDVERTYYEIMNRVYNKKRGYTSLVEREAEYYLGLNNYYNNKYDEALKHFYKCDELSRDLDKQKISGFMVMTNLKVGMIYDLQNKRNYAIDQYNKVLNMDKYENSRDQAEQYLKEPFRR